jgi:hypothetical protein
MSLIHVIHNTFDSWDILVPVFTFDMFRSPVPEVAVWSTILVVLGVVSVSLYTQRGLTTWSRPSVV